MQTSLRLTTHHLTHWYNALNLTRFHLKVHLQKYVRSYIQLQGSLLVQNLSEYRKNILTSAENKTPPKQILQILHKSDCTLKITSKFFCL